MVFSETLLNTGQDPVDLGPTCGQLTLALCNPTQPKNKNELSFIFHKTARSVTKFDYLMYDMILCMIYMIVHYTV